MASAMFASSNQDSRRMLADLDNSRRDLISAPIGRANVHQEQQILRDAVAHRTRVLRAAAGDDDHSRRLTAWLSE